MTLSGDELTRISRLRRQQSAAAVELWNARLELVRVSGSVQDVLAHLASPAESGGNNCGCNSACGAMSDAGGLVQRA